jgi:hypothetical protein
MVGGGGSVAAPALPDMTFWRLEPFVHVADVRGDLVFLDARANQYSCLTRTDAKVFHDLLANGDQDSDETRALAFDLQAAGLLVPSSDGGTVLPICSWPDATGDFHGFAAFNLRGGPQAVWRLAIAALETALSLLFRGPSRWLRRGELGSDVPLTRVCSLALGFDRLRPWVPLTGRCLPNSLLLLRYLHWHGISASWVFGVQTFPFEAHCWVEYRGVVLNDTLEHVRWFTPIAVA